MKAGKVGGLEKIAKAIENAPSLLSLQPEHAKLSLDIFRAFEDSYKAQQLQSYPLGLASIDALGFMRLLISLISDLTSALESTHLGPPALNFTAGFLKRCSAR